jgi:hypothetical protein
VEDIVIRLNFSHVMCGLLAGSAFLTPAARAHVNMVGPLESRGGDQKSGPCEGKAWGSGPVYTFEPGATISLTAEESISHDGYFRISFDDAGDDDFVDPMSIDPINPNRYGKGQECAKDNPKDRCGESDFCSFVSTDGGPTVLWDKLDPHIPNGLLNGKEWTWKVTLPDVECTKCTLQVMQIMEDANDYSLGAPVETHGPFDGVNDLYYRCIDIVLKKGKGGTTGTVEGPADNNGINCVGAVSPDGGVILPEDDDVKVLGPDAGADDETDDDGHGDGDAHDDGEHQGDGDDDDDSQEGSNGGPASGAKDGCSVSHAGGRSTSALLLAGVGLLAVGLRKRRLVYRSLAKQSARATRQSSVR